MPTFNQIAFRKRSSHLRSYNRSPKMEKCPQKLGICIRVGTTKPKKPNSAIRKIAKVNLASGHNVRAVIPGAGFDLVEHNTVLLRAGRARDIPGIHYKLIRGKADLAPPYAFERQKRRSKFGVSNWVYMLRDEESVPYQIISKLRTKRQRLQTESGLKLTWERGKRSAITRR